MMQFFIGPIGHNHTFTVTLWESCFVSALVSAAHVGKPIDEWIRHGDLQAMPAPRARDYRVMLRPDNLWDTSHYGPEQNFLSPHVVCAVDVDDVRLCGLKPVEGCGQIRHGVAHPVDTLKPSDFHGIVAQFPGITIQQSSLGYQGRNLIIRLNGA
jgi:hypothetical protein